MAATLRLCGGYLGDHRGDEREEGDAERDQRDVPLIVDPEHACAQQRTRRQTTRQVSQSHSLLVRTASGFTQLAETHSYADHTQLQGAHS